MGSIQEQHCTNHQAMLDAQLELWHNSIAFIKSMAFKSALELNIADAIDLHGGTATLAQISTKARIHPSKIPCLRRLMRVLTVTGIFTILKKSADDDDHVYGLTPASRLLVGSLSLTPILSLFLNNIFVSPFFDLGTWLEHELPAADLTLFEMSHSKAVWDVVGHDASMSLLFNAGMVADTQFLMDIAIKECGYIFQRISSLIDVAGGHGAAAQAIAKAFPHIECSVLDLPHVVASAPACTALNYIVGDMFESIPPANTVFLKWVMHDWDDPHCVTILKNCKKAIPPRDAGGKVIIVDTVVGAGSSNHKHRETQVLYDLFFLIINGIERDEQEWRKIIFEAGFIDYKITPILGLRSIIELYP
ncbi:hypothetical protein U9M48_003864 [Paspalum notatum var. saurae]|uniref:O-methyltransferase ZRP4 n=1 Tax=Paspalum notatum var. saurae TaxID=547442 RepID=A0AAQ3SK83_PASNO